MKKILCATLLTLLTLSSYGSEYVTEVKVIQGQFVEEKGSTSKVSKIVDSPKETPVKKEIAPIKEQEVAVPEPTLDSKTTPLKEETISKEELVKTEETTEPQNSAVVPESREEASKIVDETPEEPVSNVADKSQYDFTKVHNLKVTEAPGVEKKSDYLRINTRVTVLEEKTVGEKNPVKYSKIKYKKDKKVSTGWVKSNALTDKITDTLPKNWSQLDFTPMPKKNYKSNPRVAVKGIYVSATSLSVTKSLDRLIDLANKTEINAFVIDVKNDDGHLLWKMPNVVEKNGIPSDTRSPFKDIAPTIAKLKKNNIYLIARIVSFKDPTYAKTKTNKTILDKRTGKPFTNADGLIWVSAHDRNLWQYNIDVAKEAAKAGFNEIQFDYVRFPASNGGKLDPYLDYRNPNGESKPVAIQRYLKEAYKQLSPLEVYTAADVYGQVGTSPDDMALGQYWEAASNAVDYICPMVYPSHFANGTYGTKIPDAEPYKTVYGSTRDSLNRDNNIDTPAIIRTWIQDFTARWVKGHINYGVPEVKAQIKALNDLGLKEYILWNASNRYSFEKTKNN
ncbi:MAG: putative glycoside hydrolase [Fusobacteriaceae bacterium]